MEEEGDEARLCVPTCLHPLHNCFLSPSISCDMETFSHIALRRAVAQLVQGFPIFPLLSLPHSPLISVSQSKSHQKYDMQTNQ